MGAVHPVGLVRRPCSAGSRKQGVRRAGWGFGEHQPAAQLGSDVVRLETSQYAALGVGVPAPVTTCKKGRLWSEGFLGVAGHPAEDRALLVVG